MTRQSTKQRGVTLVEVMLTLAISTLLIITILSGRNSIRSQAQFSDGIEQIKENILSVKNQANTGNSTNPNAQGTGTIKDSTSGYTYLNLGRSIRFERGKSTAQTITILCYAGGDSLCTNDLNEDGKTSVVSNLPWGITYTGYTQNGTEVTTGEPSLSIVFTRNDTNGSFNGYWIPGRVSNSLNTSAPKRSELLTTSTPITLNFASTDGRKATITVNPATGAVTRNIL